MSRLDTLIADLCPNGVEFKALDEVIKLRFGTRITKMKDTGTLYPVYGGGGESFRTDDFNRDDDYVISRFAMSETCVRRVSGRFWMLDSGFTFDPIDASANKDYIGYLLFNMQPEIYACSTKGAQKNLKTEDFRRLRVPIPPLEVQNEIVEILDRLTALEVQLETALNDESKARRQQYAHYRDSLFVFSDEVPRVPMGEVGTFTRGRRFNRDDLVADGIGCIHYGEIYTHYGTFAEEPLSYVRAELEPTLRFAKPGDVVIASVGETVEDVCKAVAWLGDSDVAIHDECFAFTSSLNPRYVSHYFQSHTFNADKAKYVSRAKMKRILGDGLAKITIPIPSAEEQEWIVTILDTLTSLVSDLLIDLPAEIEARRRQYEYYRDRLLSFQQAT